MYGNAYETRPRGVRRRRRPRRKQYRRAGYLAVLLLLILAVIRVVPLLSPESGEQVATLEQSASSLAPTIQLDTTPRDTTAPQILGVRDLNVFAGEAVAYRQDITVTDDSGEPVSLEVDNSSVNLAVPGIYLLRYSASDAAGNVATAVATVTVYEKPENYVEPDVIEAAVQEVLDTILTDGMTTREQVEAIYNWAHKEFTYGGHSDRVSYQQTGYYMLTQRTGDCYGYFAASKLLFEALDIPNIDVQKVRNSPGDSDHFWSLVSVDGGESYYHFDCTPRVDQVESFCLITDAALDSYSRQHKFCHNRDLSRYPATPEEAL